MKTQQALGPAFIGAIGVVFGDIGTSPLYAFKESPGAARFQPGDSLVVLGLLSLIFSSLALVVSVEYLAVIMRADDHGEGGILSLVALEGAVLPVTLGVIVILVILAAEIEI